ncbi:MAG: GNAT family N-acetyltransferase [Anaerolineales bacterium]
MKHRLARQIEDCALRSWPALEQADFDGWLLRFANGYTKRANSVNPLYTSTLPVTEKIKVCEQRYAERGLAPIFRLTPFASPPDLDAALAARGYEVLDRTLVMHRELSPEPGALKTSGLLHCDDLGVWLDHFYTLSASSPVRRGRHLDILNSIDAPMFAALLFAGGQPIVAGLAVLDDAFVGLFDLVTAESFRRRGFGTRLVGALLDWGREHGAQHAYLQVVQANHSAQGLYSKLGFREAYRYWYRVPGNNGVQQ